MNAFNTFWDFGFYPSLTNTYDKFPQKRSFIIFSRTDMVSIADSAITDDKFTMLPRGWPSASKIEAKILKDFQLNLDHPGGKSGRESGSKPYRRIELS